MFSSRNIVSSIVITTKIVLVRYVSFSFVGCSIRTCHILVSVRVGGLLLSHKFDGVFVFVEAVSFGERMLNASALWSKVDHLRFSDILFAFKHLFFLD